MGLISAIVGAASGVLADQWLEFFYCDSIPETVLVTKGHKRVSGRSTNRGDDNIISNGSRIAVNEGQCMIIVESGKVVDLCAEPGEYTYDASTEPSLFYGNLSENIGAVFAQIGKRFTFGGEPPKDQRVYYFNTKELIGNKYGTPNPIPFRVVDQRANIDMDISIRCFGEYSYRITNPILFYANVCGNVPEAYTRDRIDGQLRSEMMTALQPAFARISDLGIRYSSVPAHTKELAQALNDELSAEWRERRGIEIVSLGVSSISATEEDEKRLKELQQAATLSNPNLAAGMLSGAAAQAMQSAAANENGAAMGFMGMGMAMNAAGGVNPGAMYQAGGQPVPPAQPGQPAMGQAPVQAAAAGVVAGVNAWQCECGTLNQGKFCTECGKPKPAGVPQYKCDKCGWTPADPTKPPKFCPECGDPFDDGDVVK